MKFAADWFPEIRSKRGQIERALVMRAIGLLMETSGCEWLVPAEADINAGAGRMRFEILSALGRLDDDADLVQLARQLCRLKPKSREAVEMVRRYRTGKEPAADALVLANAIIGTVNRWLRDRPSADWQTVQAAIDTARQKIEEAREKGPR